MTSNKELVGIIENIHLLRRIAIKRFTSSSPLHFGQIAIMKTIEANENSTQISIAEQLNVTPSSVAVSTKRLEKAGLLTKTVDTGNLRCKRLALTDKGREVISQHISLFEEYDNLIFKSFSEEEKAQLMSFLKRIIGEMQEIEGFNRDFCDSLELAVFLRKTIEMASDPKDT